ncbi:MAG: hypothetical protein ABUK01_00450 [Leptospirales bacterium]
MADTAHQCLLVTVKQAKNNQLIGKQGFIWSVYNGKHYITPCIGSVSSQGGKPDLKITSGPGNITSVKKNVNESIPESKTPNFDEGYVIDLIWSDGKPGSIQGLILYPALLTPEILTPKSESLSFVLLTLGGSTQPTSKQIKDQLKISYGLYFKEPALILSGLQEVDINVDEIANTQALISTNDFKGVIDSRVDYKSKTQEDNCYRVTIQKSVFQNGDPSKPLFKKNKLKQKNSNDEAINTTLKKYKTDKIPGSGKHCFQFEEDDINFTKSDLTRPIRSHHPVFILGKKERHKTNGYNFAQMSDIHISSREHTLRKSQAKVIEGVSDDISCPVGSMVNIASKNMKSFLDISGCSDETDIILISGDVIDHIPNARVDSSETVSEIWENLKLEDSPSLGDWSPDDNYQLFWDHIAFYSFIVYFYERFKKPSYYVTGNHDVYGAPYGITPVLFSEGNLDSNKKENHPLLNEGIPADHNLTFYEAQLIFGDTSKSVYENSSGITLKYLDWIHSCYTPFKDYLIEWDKQNIIALGWGDKEDLMLDSQGWMGHLPRSEDPFTEIQFNLLKEINNNSNNTKKHILLSHFTFISYHEMIPDHHLDGGGVLKSEYQMPNQYQINLNKDYNWYDMGTFEEERLASYKYAKERLHVIVTGHSHRRAAYTFGDINIDGTKIETRMHPLSESKYFDLDDVTKTSRTPVVVVSDSTGPLPRLNRDGEFFGWGSDQAAGLLLHFLDNDKLKVDTLKVGPKPRFCVTLDYQTALREASIEKYHDMFNSSIYEDEHNAFTKIIPGQFFVKEIDLQTPFPNNSILFLNQVGMKGIPQTNLGTFIQSDSNTVAAKTKKIVDIFNSIVSDDTRFQAVMNSFVSNDSLTEAGSDYLAGLNLAIQNAQNSDQVSSLRKSFLHNLFPKLTKNTDPWLRIDKEKAHPVAVFFVYKDAPGTLYCNLDSSLMEEVSIESIKFYTHEMVVNNAVTNTNLVEVCTSEVEVYKITKKSIISGIENSVSVSTYKCKIDDSHQANLNRILGNDDQFEEVFASIKFCGKESSIFKDIYCFNTPWNFLILRRKPFGYLDYDIDVQKIMDIEAYKVSGESKGKDAYILIPYVDPHFLPNYELRQELYPQKYSEE